MYWKYKQNYPQGENNFSIYNFATFLTAYSVHLKTDTMFKYFLEWDQEITI